jgi:hypothetical protein
MLGPQLGSAAECFFFYNDLQVLNFLSARGKSNSEHTRKNTGQLCRNLCAINATLESWYSIGGLIGSSTHSVYKVMAMHILIHTLSYIQVCPKEA